jgi:quinol monooxygenase YgiN
MAEIVVVGSLKARPGREDEARAALEALVAPTHAEDGCILYALHQGTDDPTRLAFVERWTSREHLDAHLASPHLVELGARVDELFTEPPDIVAYAPVPGGEARKGALAAHAAGGGQAGGGA